MHVDACGFFVFHTENPTATSRSDLNKLTFSVSPLTVSFILNKQHVKNARRLTFCSYFIYICLKNPYVLYMHIYKSLSLYLFLEIKTF